MALIIWDDAKYSVKIGSIDEQHKKLVAIINKLHDAMLNSSSKTIMKDIIDELVSYTKTHFQYEEGLMQKNGYGEYAAHKQTHEAFVDKVIDFQEKYLQGGLFLSIDIINFLRDWLINHIAGVDRKYIDFLTSKGVK